MITFPSIAPDQTSVEEVAANMIQVQLGNGYIHQLPNGSNAKRVDWNPMQWSGLTQANLETIDTFLASMINTGDYTTYTSPQTGNTYYLLIDPSQNAQYTNQGGATFTVKAYFKQIIL
jgi:phage-related protein